MLKKTIHPDFPHETIPGSISGGQPKALARKVNGKYVSGPTLAEVMERFQICDDLAEQLSVYALAYAREHPEWTADFNLARTRKGMEKKIDEGKWDFSLAEQAWILGRVKDTLQTWHGTAVGP